MAHLSPASPSDPLDSCCPFRAFLSSRVCRLLSALVRAFAWDFLLSPLAPGLLALLCLAFEWLPPLPSPSSASWASRRLPPELLLLCAAGLTPLAFREPWRFDRRFSSSLSVSLLLELSLSESLLLELPLPESLLLLSLSDEEELSLSDSLLESLSDEEEEEPLVDVSEDVSDPEDDVVSLSLELSESLLLDDDDSESDEEDEDEDETSLLRFFFFVSAPALPGC